MADSFSPSLSLLSPSEIDKASFIKLDKMQLYGRKMPMCPSYMHCAQWARTYLKYCLCNTKDGVSLSLGLVSVLSWGVAEIPQITTNYKHKSAEGLSIAFLMTWVIGDLFNLFGCLLEPATLPTQYYMALLYTITTVLLSGQAIYYDHIYPRQRAKQDFKKAQKSKVKDSTEKGRPSNMDRDHCPSLPIDLPSHIASPNESTVRGLYYISARSLTSSHTSPTGSFFARMSPATNNEFNSVLEPLLYEAARQSPPPSHNKNLLCFAATLTFFFTFNLLRLREAPLEQRGVVINVGRHLLQAQGEGRLGSDGSIGEGIGTFLGWAMACIYMGGRLPQIYLNIRRGHVEGLNPLMFIFALVGNMTYVASILVSSIEWSKIRPNLPWLVDAGGCVILDFFILVQFIYFQYKKKQHNAEDNKREERQMG